MAEPLAQVRIDPRDTAALRARVDALEQENQAMRERLADLGRDEVRFHTLLDATGDVIWITECDPERVVYCSASFERVWGLTVEALYREPHLWVMSIHEDDRARIGKAFVQWLANPVVRWQAEFRIVRPDGGVRWILERGVAMIEEGQKMRVLGASADVTEQRAIAAALRESEERFALAVEGSADGIWDWDLKTGMLYMSERAQVLYGIAPSPVTLRPRTEWLTFVEAPAPDVEERRLAMKRYIDGETGGLDAEWRFRQPDGTDRWRRLQGRCLRDADGKAIRLTGSISDVDARKRAEHALQESEERFALAVAGSSDGIWDWDIATGMQYYSERAQRIYGLPPGPAKRHRAEWRRLVPVHPDDDQEQENAIADYLAGRTSTYGGEWRILQPGGGYKWIRLRGECVRDAAGLPIRLAGSVSDIDTFKREQASRQQSQRLEAVGTLAGGIAHDFNNILGAILGFGEMSLRRTRKGSVMRRDLECIVTAGERGRALVDRILAFSRSSVSERVPVHVEKIVQESIELLKPVIPAEVRLTCDFRAGAAAVMGDATQVHQVLGNLATNAVQAMFDGGELTIVLEAMSLSEPRLLATGSIGAGEYVVLTVRDTGSGIAPADRQRIFDPFFTTKEVNVGTGLGLSLVHGIVAELGGAIDLASRVGEGSTFVVYLPRSGDVGPPLEVSKPDLPRGALQRILVVDDDPALTRLTSRLCADLGYQWMACTSSIEAARVFRSRPHDFDAVLTDERMPGLSGTDLIRSMREVRSDIPIIVMSGYLGEALVSRARIGGATAVMAKPVSRADLAGVLSQALDGGVDAALEPHNAGRHSRRRNRQRSGNGGE